MENECRITCEQSQQEGKNPKAGRRRHLDGHQSHTRWLVKWQQSRSVVRGGRCQCYTRLSLSSCCLVSAGMYSGNGGCSAAAALTILHRSPCCSFFFLRPLLDGLGVCSYWAGLYLFILWKAEEREKQRYNIRKKPGIEPSISRRWCTPIVVVPSLLCHIRGWTDRSAQSNYTHVYIQLSGSRVDLSLWYVPLSYPLFLFTTCAPALLEYIGLYDRSFFGGGCDIANDSRE